jgi:RNA polymerase sigma-70 factor (ECF subfamily)
MPQPYDPVMVGAEDPISSTPPAPEEVHAGAHSSPASSTSQVRRAEAQRWITDHAGTLWRFALARTRSPAAAEEIVQETLLAALNSASGPASVPSERSWLLGIASHKIADYFRQASKHARLAGAPTARPTSDPCFSPDGSWARPPAAILLPEDSAERSEQLGRLRQCMDALPPSLDQVIWLREVLGLTSADVCDILALTPQALWTRLHRARSSLRECMERATAARQARAAKPPSKPSARKEPRP